MMDVLKPPGSLLATCTDRSKAVVLVWFLLNVFGVGVSCRNLYSIVDYLYVDVVDQLPRLGKRELICLLLFTCNYVVFVWRGFLFLWVPGMGYVILLWHSLSLPYNYFELIRFFSSRFLWSCLARNMSRPTRLLSPRYLFTAMIH